jgi:hypothetical protein
MKKWADYLISAMRITKSSNNNFIAYFKVHKDKGEFIGSGSTWTKDEVLEAIKNGNTFLTIYKENNGKWKKGSGIHEIIFEQLFKSHDKEIKEENKVIALPEF